MERINNSNIVVVSGVSGAGKDFLLSRVQENMHDKTDVDFIHFGRIIREIARAEQPAGYSEASGGLSGIDPVNMEEFKTRATIKLLDGVINANDRAKVMNYHSTYKQNGLIIADSNTIFRLRPRDLIMVESDAEEILARRIANSDIRNRELESVDAIKYHQELEKSFMHDIVKKIGARSLLLCNISDDLRNISNNISLIMERILTK